MPATATLRDSYRRPVTNLRISLTSRCNLSCIYCHAEGEKNPDAEMSAQEILGIIRAVPRGIESSLTTNGILLADMAEDLKSAGLRRVNISLDSLNPDTYKRITGSDRLGEVLAGIDAALKACLTPVKLNMVVLSGINDNEIDDF